MSSQRRAPNGRAARTATALLCVGLSGCVAPPPSLDEVTSDLTPIEAKKGAFAIRDELLALVPEDVRAPDELQVPDNRHEPQTFSSCDHESGRAKKFPGGGSSLLLTVSENKAKEFQQKIEDYLRDQPNWHEQTIISHDARTETKTESYVFHSDEGYYASASVSPPDNNGYPRLSVIIISPCVKIEADEIWKKW